MTKRLQTHILQQARRVVSVAGMQVNPSEQLSVSSGQSPSSSQTRVHSGLDSASPP